MLNNAVLMGRLTADPELRHIPNGRAVTSFTLAVNRSYVKSGTERQTDFIDIVAWGSTAEFVSRYFHKGQLVAVQGRIQVRAYVDKNGNNRRAFEIVADNVHFAESWHSHSNDSQDQTNDQYEREQAPQAAEAYSSGDNNDFEEIPTDDDLPF